ncbi:AI-2E family transporter [Halomarina salina]|uniref:AI-2E family transporter n=1 Tax=Halomarina salina TaxID=1872699 RepID=A0ABD5RPW4_9EURY|nr:AI-2E family transporter [Halomarina salina]
MRGISADLDQSRLAWWLLGAILVGLLYLAVQRFLGAFVFGLFLYYAVRPVSRRVRRLTDSSGLAATSTLLLVALPLVALIAYIVARLVLELDLASVQHLRSLAQPYLDVSSLLSDPRQLLSRLRDRNALQFGATAFSMLSAVLVQLFVALAFVFFVLRDDHRLAGWFRSAVGDERSVSYAYLSAVDRDLESVFLGNTMMMITVGILSVFTYNGFNLLAPAGLTIPFPTALGLLTGLASLVPLVVGKLVYVPVGAYLLWLAAQGEASFVFPVGFLLFSFLFLDLFPQTFVQPYLAGQSIHVGLTVFAYILGTTLFGWYGLFLGPLLMVLMVQFVRIVFTELVHDSRITPRVTDAESLGSSPRTDTTGASSDE